MLGRFSFRLICLVLAVAGLQVGPASTQTASPPDIPDNVNEIDWATLLTTADPVDGCIRYSESYFSQKYGSDFLPESYARLSCECMADSIKHHMEQTVPDRPEIHRLTLHMTVNLDVSPILFNENVHPGGMESFLAFFNANGEAVLGVSAEEFTDLIGGVGEAFQQKYQTREDAMRMAEEVPSCRASLEVENRTLGDGRIIEIDQLDSVFAIQALKHDPGISLFQLDVLLLSETPVERLCVRSMLESDGDTVSNDVQAYAVVEAFSKCMSLFEIMKAELQNPSERETDAALRVMVLAFDAFGKRTSSNAEDLRYYLTDRAEQVGVPAEKLHGYFDFVLALSRGEVMPKCPAAWYDGDLQDI